jgi:hypothetical protein
MKRKIYIFLSIYVFINFNTEAQSVYNSSSFASVADTIYMTSAQLASLNFDTSGANLIWDFSSLISNSQRQIIFRNPTQTGVPWPFIFNASNTNLSSTDNSSVSIGQFQYTNTNDFYLKNAAALAQTASSSVIIIGNLPYTLKNQYSSPDVLLDFPLTYGNSDSSFSQYTTTIPNIFSRTTSIKRNNYVSGWGTITTPYNSFTNCLKLESLVTQIDTTFYKELRWLDPAFKYDVFRVRQTKIGGTYTTQSIEYYDTQQFFQPTALFVYNPVTPIVNDTVFFQSLSSNSSNILWDFDDPSSGINNTSTSNYVSHQFTSPGTYNVRLIANNGPLSDTIVLPVNIDDVPSAISDFIISNEDSTINFDVLANDIDLFGGINQGSLSIILLPQNGAASISNGMILYSPNADFFGFDTLVYEICDIGNPVLCDTALVFLTINSINDAPLANADSVTCNEDSLVNINILSNDSDVDDNMSTVTVNVISQPQNGIAVNNNGVILYTPNNDFFGFDTLAYEICDNGNPVLCDTALVFLTINSINDAPLANADSVTCSEDSLVNINILTNDSDVDDNMSTVTVNVISQPQNGIAVNNNGVILYTPNADFYGFDTLAYEICDIGNPVLCDTALVYITVNQIIINSTFNHTKNENKIIIFPNPFENKINLNIAKEEYMYAIYSADGVCIWRGKNIQSCDFSFIVAGNYWIEISQNNRQIQIIKILKK